MGRKQIPVKVNEQQRLELCEHAGGICTDCLAAGCNQKEMRNSEVSNSISAELEEDSL